MRPIILPSDTTSFPAITNGLGRLSDCYSCLVTEEINSTYTATAACHVSSPHSDLIVEGNYLYLQHDSTGDYQPFEIRKVTKKNDGTIEAYCEHISYKLTRATAIPYTSPTITSALSALAGNTRPSQNFTFASELVLESDPGFSVNYPKTVRAVLNGTEGSLVDVYGRGEWLFDRWTCTLKEARGTLNKARIRSGHNLTSLVIQSQSTNWYKAIFPFYYNSTDGTRVLATSIASTGRVVSRKDETDYTVVVPVDLTDKFTDTPTSTEVRKAGYAWLDSNKPWNNEPTIQVKWSALDEEAAGVVLGDTVTVQDKTLGYKADHRIVKTVWDCLKERYDSVEVGKLSPTLYDLIRKATK